MSKNNNTYNNRAKLLHKTTRAGKIPTPVALFLLLS